MPNVQWRTPDDGQRNWPKHVEFLDKKKFGKISASVGFIKNKFVTMHGNLNVKKSVCYFHVVHSSAKCFVSRQQWTGNPSVHYRGKDKWFCIVNSYVEVKNNTKGKNSCVFVATLVTLTRCNVTLY